MCKGEIGTKVMWQGERCGGKGSGAIGQGVNESIGGSDMER
jgi:hypothetical protein